MLPPLPIRIILLTASLLFQPSLNALDESEALALLIQALDQSDDPSAQTSLIKGVLSGLEGRRDITPPQSWTSVGSRLMASDNKALRRSAQQLAQLFGDKRVAQQALATLDDTKLDTALRLESFKALLAQRNESLGDLLPDLLNDPDLQTEAIRAYGVMPQTDGATTLLKAYPNFNADAQRVVIETLATRKESASDLLGALKRGEINKQDLPTYVARSLQSILGETFTRFYGDIEDMSGDKKALFAKYRDLLTSGAMERADASKGRAIFERACAACHQLYGSGGIIGPDLTGSNRANLDYILLNILDPSDDIPESYRMVTVTTESGQVLVGAVTKEDPQRLTLNAVGQQIVIAKSDIKSRVTSEISMMPEGLLSTLDNTEVVNLIQYLRTEEQVEAHPH